MLATGLLFGLVLVASVTDVLRHKISNWTTYPGILAAVGASAARSALLAATSIDESRLAWLTPILLRDCLIGFVACGLLMTVCFVFFRIGGGDVKLMAMLGAFLGWEDGITAMLWTFVFGACMALTILIWRVGPLALAAKCGRWLLATLRLGRWSALTEDERAMLQPPLFLAPSALAAVVVVKMGWLSA